MKLQGKNIAVQNEHFVYAFVDISSYRKWRLWRSILQAYTILYKEVQCTKYDYFNVYGVFGAILDWNQV